MHNTSHPLYSVWSAIRRRCNNPNIHNYKYYGGKGIRVCKEWDNFKTFVKDMGPRPDGYTIERIDSNKDYCKSNCRWASVTEQNNNKSDNVYLTLNGETKSLKEWSEFLNIDYQVLNMRRHRFWSDERILTTPLRGKK